MVTFFCENIRVFIYKLDNFVIQATHFTSMPLFSLPHIDISVSHGVTATSRSSTTPTSTPSPTATSIMTSEGCQELSQNSPTGTRGPSLSPLSSLDICPGLDHSSVSFSLHYVCPVCRSYLCAFHTQWKYRMETVTFTQGPLHHIVSLN